MDRQYLVNRLKTFAERFHISIDEESLSHIICKSSFRVVSKGEILSAIGDDTEIAGMVLSGLTRCYYIDSEGNDITRGFAAAGYLCMDEGFFGYPERLCMWEALEESTVMLCKTSEIRRLIHENALFKDVWITLLEKAMRYKIYRENGFLVENATERYLHFKKQFPELYNKLPQKHIATYLGITPESLSRIRRNMREEINE